jgi:asparagine synthetase A
MEERKTAPAKESRASFMMILGDLLSDGAVHKCEKYFKAKRG